MANNFWLGAADDVKQVDTITVAGTWAAGDTATITCNSKTVMVTVGSSVAVADVASALAASIMAVDATSNIINDETRNRGGRELGEFRDIEATSSAAVLTLTSAMAGVPFEVTRSEVTAGDGELGAVTSVTAATGKNWFDNAANWSGTLTAVDTLVFDSGSTSILYGLDNTTLDIGLDRTNAYSGNIGLPVINTTHSGYPYPEYRQQYLDLPVTDTAGSSAHIIGGRSDQAAAGYTHLDFGTNTPSSSAITVAVLDAPAIIGGTRAVKIVGGEDLRLAITKGSVDIGDDRGANASEVYSLITLGASADVNVGENTTFKVSAAESIDARGGSVELHSDMDATSGLFRQEAGNVMIGQGVTLRKIAQHGGTFDFRGLAIYVLYGYGGTFDASLCNATGHTNDLEFHAGYTFKDPHGALVSSYQIIGCGPGDITLELPDNQVHTLTASSGCVII